MKNIFYSNNNIFSHRQLTISSQNRRSGHQSRLIHRAYSVTNAESNNQPYYQETIINPDSAVGKLLANSPLTVNSIRSEDSFGRNAHADSGIFQKALNSYSTDSSIQSELWKNEDDSQTLGTAIQPKILSQFSVDQITLYTGYSICDVLNKMECNNFTRNSTSNSRVIITAYNALAMLRLGSYSIMLQNTGNRISDNLSIARLSMNLTPYLERLFCASVRSSYSSLVDLKNYETLKGVSNVDGSLLETQLEIYATPDVYIGGRDFYKKCFIEAFSFIPGECDDIMVNQIADVIFSSNPNLTTSHLLKSVDGLSLEDCEVILMYLSSANLSIFVSELEQSLTPEVIRNIILTNNRVMAWNNCADHSSTFLRFANGIDGQNISWFNLAHLRGKRYAVLNESFNINNLYYAYVFMLSASEQNNMHTKKFFLEGYTDVGSCRNILNADDNYKWLSLVMFGRTFNASTNSLKTRALQFAEPGQEFDRIKELYPLLKLPFRNNANISVTQDHVSVGNFNINHYQNIRQISSDFLVFAEFNGEKNRNSVPTLDARFAILLRDSTSNAGASEFVRYTKSGDQGGTKRIKANINSYDKLVRRVEDKLQNTSVTLARYVPLNPNEKIVAYAFTGRRKLNTKRDLTIYNSNNDRNERLETYQSIVNNTNPSEITVLPKLKPNLNIKLIEFILEGVYLKQAYGVQFLKNNDINNIMKNVAKIDEIKDEIKNKYHLAICLPTCTGKTRLAREFPKYFIDIDELINSSNHKHEINENRRNLFNATNDAEIQKFVKIERDLIEQILNNSINNGLLKGKVLLAHSELQFENIERIVAVGSLKLPDNTWNYNINQRRLKARDKKSFENNIRIAKLNSNKYVELSQSLLKLVMVLIAYKYS